MKTPILKAWQWALVAGGVAFVGIGLNVTGETTSPSVASGISAAANSASPVVSTDAPVAGVITTNEVFRPSTNNPAPADLKISPDLAEIIKLAQAGLSEEVMLAYITNSIRVFNLGPDEIIYLNDLGVPSSVITAMIQPDTALESAARKLAGNEPTPLSPGLALNSPASNVYPAQQPPAPPPEEPSVESATEAPLAPTYAVTGHAPQPAAVSYFYNSLAPYGNWVEVSGYGLCWQPTVVLGNSNWRPYSDRGRWVYSDCGWYWLSDYSWGWAPFHYGRWVTHGNYGWVWSPDSTWGPAWVSWRYSQNYCGWAPLPPEARFTVGVGFSFHHRAVGVDFEFGLRAHHYNFIPFDRFCDYSPSRHRVSPIHVNNVYNQTTFVNKISVRGNHNNIVINEGLDPAHVAAVTRSQVRKVAVRDTSTPAGRAVKYDHLEREGNRLVVFRPQLPAPSHSKPAATGGRASRENRDKAAALTRNSATVLNPTGRAEIPAVAGSGSPRSPRSNTTRIRPSSQPNSTQPASSMETDQARGATRSSNGLAMRGEPRRAQIAPATETASGANQNERDRSQHKKEPQRPAAAQNQVQAQPGLPQTQSFAPVQPTVIPGVADSDATKATHGNTTTILPSSQSNVWQPKALPETEQSRVSARSSSGLAMRGEPRRAQIAPVTETASGASRSEPNRLQNTRESQRPTGAHNQPQVQPQAQPGIPQTQTFAPVQRTVRPVTETARVERQQPHVFRPEQRAPQAAPARQQFIPAPPVNPQPSRVEPRNTFRPQLARSDFSPPPSPPAHSPQASVAPARVNVPRANAQQSAPKPDKRDRNR